MFLQFLLPCLHITYFFILTFFWLMMKMFVLMMLMSLWLWFMLFDLDWFLHYLNFFRFRVARRLLDCLLSLNMIRFFFLNWLVMVNLVILLLVSMVLHFLMLNILVNLFSSNNNVFMRFWLGHRLFMMVFFMFLFSLLVMRRLQRTQRLRNSFNDILNNITFLLLSRLFLLMLLMILFGYYLLLLLSLLMVLLLLLWRVILQGIWLSNYFLTLQLNLLGLNGLLSERYFNLFRLDFMLRLRIVVIYLLLMSRLFLHLWFTMMFFLSFLHLLLHFLPIFNRFLRRFICESWNLLLRLNIHLSWLPFIGQVALSTGFLIGRIRVYSFFIVRMLGHCSGP